MINIKNTQRKITIPIALIKKDLEKILEILDYKDFDIGVWFTTDKTIRFYNKTYRNKDKPTDILSFSYHENLKAGERIKIQHEEDKNFGDLIISAQYLQKDAQKFEQSFNERLRILLVHGICHLLGYDHINDNDYEIMREKENFILNKLK